MSKKAIKPLLESWRSQQKEVYIETQFGSFFLTLFVWADDHIILATSMADFYDMVCDLTAALSSLGLHWKTNRLEIMINPWARDHAAMVEESPGLSSHLSEYGLYDFTFKGVSLLEVLGVHCDCSGSVAAVVCHRLAKGDIHFNVRARQLCRQRVSISLRAQRYYQTVAKTVLWGSGG